MAIVKPNWAEIMTIEEMKKIKFIVSAERSNGKTQTSLWLAFKRAYELCNDKHKISPYIFIKEG